MNLICTLRSLSAFAVITLAACGGGDDNGSTTPAATSGTGTIGASSGTVASANGVATAVFPANAFATDTAVTIAASSSAPASAQLVSGYRVRLRAIWHAGATRADDLEVHTSQLARRRTGESVGDVPQERGRPQQQFGNRRPSSSNSNPKGEASWQWSSNRGK